MWPDWNPLANVEIAPVECIVWSLVFHLLLEIARKATTAQLGQSIPVRTIRFANQDFIALEELLIHSHAKMALT